MSLKFDKSEDFRAQIYLTTGYFCCTPFGLNLSLILTEAKLRDLLAFVASLLLFLLGVFLISKSYYIMYKKDLLSNAKR